MILTALIGESRKECPNTAHSTNNGTMLKNAVSVGASSSGLSPT